MAQTKVAKKISPMREISSKLNATSKTKIEMLRKAQADERKALREKHKTEVAKVREEAKTLVSQLMQKMLDSLMETDALQTKDDAKKSVVFPVKAEKTAPVKTKK